MKYFLIAAGTSWFFHQLGMTKKEAAFVGSVAAKIVHFGDTLPS